MFDKTFFKFAVGFAGLIFLCLASLFVIGRYYMPASDAQTAAVR
jgi:hypothetical protein